MFEFVKLAGQHPRRIALETAKGRDIDNVCSLQLSEQHLRRFRLFLDKYGRQWKLRRSPSGRYNCAGHVWASRRTCIYEELAWKWILEDDEYRQTEHPIADDLVIYVDRTQGILHIGRIVELKAISIGSREVPFVVSKWSDCTGEVIHSAYDHPYRESGFDVAIEFWTDRPAQQDD